MEMISKRRFKRVVHFSCMNGVSNHLFLNRWKMPIVIIVSKVTLDIICLTAFGYRTDSLHDPHNELADAYHDLLNLQSGIHMFLHE